MTFDDYREPVRLLKESTKAASSAQLELANKVGLVLNGNEPHDVAGAMLEEHLKPLIWGSGVEDATARQYEYLTDLGATFTSNTRFSKKVASAWIQYYLALKNVKELERLKPEAGLGVIERYAWVDVQTGLTRVSLTYFIVSSIGEDGRVFFKGGNGKSAWSSSLAKAKKSDDPATYPRFH